MRSPAHSSRRQGTVLPLVVVCLVALMGFVALAIDLGLLMVARTECQHVADSAAMAGARTLTGDTATNCNYAAVGPNVVATATSSQVMSQPVASSAVTHEIGYYTYNRTTNAFGPILPSSGATLPTNENWSLVRVQVSSNTSSAFAKVFGVMSLQASAFATAVHRPRDTCIIMDYSGSMSFDSLLGAPYSGSRTQSQNPDPIYPQFGHHSAYNPVATAGYILSSGEVLGLSNTAVDTNAGTAIVNDFYQNALGGSPLQAFSPAPDSYATAPGGDDWLRTNNNNNAVYASRLTDVFGSSAINLTWESTGYSSPFLHNNVAQLYNGYTVGPRYWGKTFFIWPPDPRVTDDWRSRFFFKADGVTPLSDNSALWTTGTNPAIKAPRTSSATNFYINYAAILRWLKTTGPNPFPTQLRAGRIVYYSAIPDVSNPLNDAALNSRFYVKDPTDLNERFWKHYIDFVLGYSQTGSGPVYSIIVPNSGYGADFTWGTKLISAKPALPDLRSMNYDDNPPRSKTRFWFGPMSMVDFIDNYNLDHRWMPGTAHQAPLWACKIGMRAGILDMRNNHPNDYVALTYFNTPEYSAGDGGCFNRVRSPLGGRSFQRMIDSLFYPTATIDDPVNFPEIRPYDTANMREVPRASRATCPAISFMHAYNQFSSNPSLVTYSPSPAPPGEAGGLGRIGTQKMIIFMTDGVANTAANASFVNNGAYQSYYRVRYPGEFPSNDTGSYSTVEDQLYGIANQICALDTAAAPGYSKARKPVIIHCIAFGSLFDPSVAPAASAARDSALSILQTVQHIGSTQADDTTPLPSYKIIIGTSTDRVTKIQTCFQKIMQEQVSVSLIE